MANAIKDHVFVELVEVEIEEPRTHLEYVIVTHVANGLVVYL